MLHRLNVVLRIILGTYLIVAGTNYYLEFSPIPAIQSQLGRDIMKNFADSGLYEAVKILEIVIGPMILLDLFTPLCLTIVFPVTVMVFWLNIFAFDSVALGKLAGTLLLAVNGWLMLTYLPLFRPMLAFRAKPSRTFAEMFAKDASADQR